MPAMDGPFLRACRLEKSSPTPVWFLRQAGRYMPEYRKVRAKVSFPKLCRDPGLCAEVAVTAQRRLGVDAAIVFSDILLVLEPLGFRLEYAPGGPKILNPVRRPSCLKRLREADPAALAFIAEAVKATRAALPSDIPLIGFSGAPFTLASYAIEGGSSRNFQKTKAFLYRHPEAWNELLGMISRALIGLLQAQATAGAQALQLFDSWVGCLSPSDYRARVLPHTRRILRTLPRGVPVIHFGTSTGGLLEAMRDAGGDVIGLDPTVSMAEARRRLGPKVAVQGNLDPCVLFSDRRTIRREARRILAEAGGRGHIFNLGHGVLPTTPVDNVRALVDFVHEATT